MTCSTISIEIDGIEVKGLITFRNKFGVGVEIISPYQNMNARELTPIEEFGCGGYMSDIGIDIAKFLLSKVYGWCSLAESKKEILTQKYNDLLFEREQYHKAVKVLRIQRINLKKRFKNGEFTQKEYQTLLRHQREERIKMLEQLGSIDVNIFAPCFGGKVDVDMIKKIVWYISKQI